MTTRPLLTTLLPLVSDLSRDLPDQSAIAACCKPCATCCHAMQPPCCAWMANG